MGKHMAGLAYWILRYTAYELASDRLSENTAADDCRHWTFGRHPTGKRTRSACNGAGSAAREDLRKRSAREQRL